ncbi:MAG TPA: hypothetical protein VLK59_05900 [Solirubrobacteraceae bacterium]|nr:hypothetical protein [Solirubrobacteraceae bacterium]
MFRNPRTTAALGLALLAAAVPAAAHAQAPAHVAVPAGRLQHTVTDLTFPAAKNTFHHDALRNERWIGATAGRELVTDVSTGKVREDCQYTLVVSRCWAPPLSSKEPAAGTTYIMPGDPILLESWDDVGAGVKALVGQSRGYSITGNTTFLGRPALTLAQQAQRGPDGGIASATVIAEADNYYPLFREDVDTDQPYHKLDGSKGGLENVDEVTTTQTMEVISPAGVKLTIDAHPRAKVVDDRPAAVAARKKAAAQRRHKHPTRKRSGYGRRSAAQR